MVGQLNQPLWLVMATTIAEQTLLFLWQAIPSHRKWPKHDHPDPHLLLMSLPNKASYAKQNDCETYMLQSRTGTLKGICSGGML
jgi:hypothetical protein